MLRSGGFASIVDQLFSSLSIVLLTFATARVESVSEFGKFAILQAVMVLVVSGYRVIPGTWTLTTGHHGSDQDFPGQGAAALALTWGFLASPLLLAAGLLVDVRDLTVVPLLMLALPPLIGLHGVRLVEYRRQNPWRAAAFSVAQFAIYTATLFTALSLMAPTWRATATAFSAAAWIALAVALLWARTLPRFSRMYAIIKQRSGTWALLTTYASNSVRQLGVPLMTALGGSFTAVAGVRGAQTLAGLPLQVPEGLQPLFVARASAYWRDHGVFPERLLSLWNRGQLALILPCIAASLVVPDSVGETLLGETWTTARTPLAWIFVSALFSQLLVGLEMRGRVTDTLRNVARVRAVTVIPTLGLVGLGAAMHQATGAAAGLAVGTAAAWLCAHLLHVRDHPRDR